MEEIGLDIGTSKTAVWRRQAIVYNEPSAITVDTRTRDLLYVGKDAAELEGRTPATSTVIRPVTGGVTHGAEGFDLLSKMVGGCFHKIKLTPGNFSVKLAVPDTASEEEATDLVNAVMRAGAVRVDKIPASYAAAIGNGLRVDSQRACMILTVGADISQLSVFNLGQIQLQQDCRPAGNAMSASILLQLENRLHIRVSKREAERIKLEIGRVEPAGEEGEKSLSVCGRDCVSGMPTSLTVRAEDVANALKPYCHHIIKQVGRALEQLPDDLSRDIDRYGMLLDGGVSALPGIASLFSRCLHMRVLRAKHPTESVARGLGYIIDTGNNFIR